MARHPWPLLALGTLVVAIAATACVPSTVVTTAPTATATPTLTPTPVPTTCPQLAGFASATPLTLAHMRLPDNTVARPPTTTGGGTGQFTVADYYACAPNSTTDLIINTGKGPEAFTHLLLFFGWAPNSTFPADAEFQSACGSAACFVSKYFGNADDPITQMYLELKSVTDNGHGLITFHLLLATPPAKPACNVPIYDTNPHPYITAWGSGSSAVQLPPLTREGTSNGHAGSSDNYFCSAGTAATISTFMNKAFPMAGWSPGSGSYPVNICTYNIKGSGVTYCVTLNITDPTDWVITTHAPM